MAYCKSSKKLEDFFNNAPDIVIDKILEKLPIHEAAKMSVLSKKWTRAWLSLKDLVFDFGFWEKLENEDNGSCDWQKCSNIIGNILLHHIGPIHYFYLRFKYTPSVHPVTHRQWIAFLSKNGVRKIVMHNCFLRIDITPYIFSSSELVHLQLFNFKLNPPPTDFGGFPNLKYLTLHSIVFVEQNVLSCLTENCRKLETLELGRCSGVDDIVIDAPSLQSLILRGDFESLAFGNICSLKRILIALKTMPKKVDIVRLASCCQLQSINFDDNLHKFFAAGSIRRSFPVTFNHVHKLCLCYLKLGDSGVFRDFLSTIKCCPNIKKLDISVSRGESVGKHILDYHYDDKLNCLREVNIEGITGSSAELKLVECLFAISTVLETLSFKYGSVNPESKMEILKGLMKFPRVSPKASLVCLER